MASSPPYPGLKIMRGLFTRGDKDGLPAELRKALSLLQLSGLEELEYRFLATESFLKPWAVFRDSLLVLEPNSIANTTIVAASEGGRGISRTDILWFYTQFDEDMYRHDPWARDDRFYVYIDKKSWSVEEYEKHLFSWLLQTFKVGKAHNPWGFDYFQLRNICTVWQAVFVPVVNAVRASYSVKGRRHYGRLALFVEERCPSGLSFPNGNVNTLSGNLFSTSPHRVLLPPKNNSGFGVLTRKHYDDTEKELRTVYPQYGGLVERPKFKHKMEEWLEEQRARANIRKAAERAREAKASQSEVVKGDGSQTPTSRIYTAKDDKGQDNDGSISPIRRVSNSIRRSFSRSLFKLTPPEQPKSPLHGVTRQLYIPDDLPSPDSQDEQSFSTVPRRERSTSADSSDTTIITPWPRPDTGCKSSKQSGYNAKRVSTPMTIRNETQLPRVHVDVNGSVSSRKDPPSGIPRLARRDTRHEQQDTCIAPISDQKPYAERRIPSYEGSEWGNPDIARANAGRAPEPSRPKTSTTRLPAPIKPTPYYGRLRVAAENNNRDVSSRAFESPDKARPKPVAWPGTSPADKSVLSAVSDQDGIIPALPTKGPERRSNTRYQAGISQVQQRARSGSDRSVTRIVSKENIRAALGGHSRDSSMEDVSMPPCVETDREQGSGTASRDPKLQTYNTHMFPRGDRRKGTPVGGWVGAPISRNATG